MEDFAWCQCFAVWVPDLYRHHDAYDFYVQARDFFYRQVELHADRVAHVRDAREIDSVLASGRVAALLTLENPTPVNHSVYAIHQLAEDGVKIDNDALMWNDRNAIGSGFLIIDGLTTFGREAIRAFEDERIVIDVSHLNDAGFADLMDVVRRPFVASHSNARAVCGNPRNLTDNQFRAIRDMVGSSASTSTPSSSPTAPARCAPCGGNPCCAEDAGTGVSDGRPDTGSDATFDELAAHIEHFLDLGAKTSSPWAATGTGSDVPVWLATCDAAGQLRHLLARRFGDELADKICFSNARDFFVRNETA